MWKGDCLGQRVWMIVTAIVVVGFVITTIFLKSDISALEDKNEKLTEEKQALQQETAQQESSTEDETEQDQNNETSSDDNEDDAENTLDEDIQFVVKNVYEVKDRKTLYDKIGSSLSDKVSEQLFGSKEFEDKNKEDTNEGKTESEMIKEVQNMDFYGKYTSDTKYSAVVLFDLHIESHTDVNDVSSTSSFIVQLEAQKKDGSWYITKLEEL